VRVALGACAGALAYVAITRAARPTAATATAQSAGAGTVVSAEADSLLRHVRALAADSMEGRLIGSRGGARARAYIVRELEAAGVPPAGASYERPFERVKTHVRPPLGPARVTYRGVNVVGLVRGRTRPERYVVVTAHYDHLGAPDGVVHNGADDNASGVAALLQLAAHFRRHPAEHSLLFAALDGEERGRLGAIALLADPPVPVAAMALDVNMDMVGRNASGELFAAGTGHSPWLRPPLDTVARAARVRLRFGHDDQAWWRAASDWTSSSDHGAFHDRGIPFVYFGEEDHVDYHRPTDDVERLMPAFLAGAAATVRDAVTALDRSLAAAPPRTPGAP
jgi:hypothetical protein